MGRFMQLLSHNLSDGLFGIWLIGMGIVYWVNPGSPGILMSIVFPREVNAI